MRVVVREDPRGALPLMEQVLRAAGDLATEYPLVFREGAQGQAVVAEEDGEILSGCALLTRRLVVGEERLDVGMIGSVATAASQRGRGLASSVLERAEAELTARGCLFALLWADSPEFYTARGYQEVGAEVDVGLQTALAASLPATEGVRPAGPGDFPAMHELYQGHAQRVERGAAESAALFETPGMRMVVRTRGDEVLAYACRGRGGDLPNVVHEWAGGTEDVLACLRSLLEEADSEDLYLMAPWGEQPVLTALLERGAPAATGVLGMGKLLDPSRAAALLASHAESELELTVGSQGSYRFAHGPRGATLDVGQLLQALVPAHGRPDVLTDLSRRLATPFVGLPLAPFAWGLDSI